MGRIAIYLGESLPPNLVRLLSGIGQLAAQRFEFVLVGSGVDPSPLPDRFSYYDVPDATADRGLTRLLATRRRVATYLDTTDHPPDAVWQITAPQFHALPVGLAARRRGVRVATRLPGNKFDEFREQDGTADTLKTFLLNNVALRTLRYSTLVVVLSEHNRDNLVARGVPDEKIHVLRPPLDTDQFAPVSDDQRHTLKGALGFDADAHCPLYVGRFSKLKGMADYESVVAHFEGDENYEFHFVGTGEFEERLAAYDNTVVHGFVDPVVLHRYYKAADILVHPSYIEEEGISWTMIEAAATGLPVVARDVENAADLSSVVFTDTADVVEYLATPDSWQPAPYPTEWSLEHLEPAYNAFFEELVSG
jgi:glycosyltransferase involved in cell wall biosynthesis